MQFILPRIRLIVIEKVDFECLILPKPYGRSENDKKIQPRGPTLKEGAKRCFSITRGTGNQEKVRFRSVFPFQVSC